MLALEVGAGHVVEIQRGRGLAIAAGKEAVLDVRLPVLQPGEIAVQRVFIKGRQVQDGGRAQVARQTHGAQARALVEGAGDDLPERQPALGVVAERGDEAELLGQAAEHHDGTHARPLGERSGGNRGGGWGRGRRRCGRGPGPLPGRRGELGQEAGELVLVAEG